MQEHLGGGGGGGLRVVVKLEGEELEGDGLGVAVFEVVVSNG